eukprot:113513_1
MGTTLSDLQTNCASKCCCSDTNNDNTIITEIIASTSPQQTPTVSSNQSKIDSVKGTTENDTEKTLSNEQNINYNTIELKEETNTGYSMSNSLSENKNAVHDNKNIQVKSEIEYDKNIILENEKQPNTVNSNTKTVNNVNINKMKILFLDIDGVLNDKSCMPRTVKADLLLKLKKIIISTDCKIVLSSSWRRVYELKNKFKKEFNKITELDIENIYIGDTPCNGRNPTRVHEIMEYFERNEDKGKFKQDDVNWVVVDDMDLLNENPAFKKQCKKLEKFIDGHWIQTNIEIGLNDQNVEEIISILNGAY